MIREKAKANAREVVYADLWELDVWGADYFGTADSSLHTVTEGRWAYTQVPKADVKDNKMANA
jgi:hypothetical protein